MRRTLAVLSALIAAGCAGHSGAAPQAAPAPGGAAPARAAAPAAEPTTIRYAAGTNRYRIETQQHTAQEMMGNTQTIDVSTTQLLSVSLASAGDSLTVRATVDSMKVQLSQPVPGSDSAADAAARAVVGKTVTGFMTAHGRTSNIQASDTGLAMAQVVTGVREFFLELPAGALAAGREWTDTAVNNQAMGPLNMRTQAIRTHHIAGWEDRDGQRALHVVTTSNYTVSGSGEAQGQPLDLSGSGRVTMDRWISAAGVYLGLTEADSSDMNVNVTSMGMSIPVRRTQRATVTRLP